MKLGIIGCGTIAATYVQALKTLSDRFQITALYDLQRAKAEALCPIGASIFCSLDEMLAGEYVDAVIISTPLPVHAQIAAECLRRKKHVFLEKPAAPTLPEIAGLYELASEMGVAFYVAFHAAFALDIDWYLNKLGNGDPIFRTEHICHLECGFFDPYLSQGQILPDRKALGGSYIDSGVNILSVCSRLVFLENMRLETHDLRKTAGGTVYASETELTNGQVQIRMYTGWDRGISQKRTLLRFRGTEDRILLDHTGQSVWRLRADGQQTLLFQAASGERMVNQYIQVFRDFDAAVRQPSLPIRRKQVMDVHRLLFSPLTRP